LNGNSNSIIFVSWFYFQAQFKARMQQISTTFG